MKCSVLCGVGLAVVVCAGSVVQAQPGLPSTTDFDLVCSGTGDKLERRADDDRDSQHHEYRDHTSLGRAQVGGTAQIEIHGGEGRVRLPQSLLPPLDSGGRDNWFPIHDLVIGPERIQGALRINGLDEPG